VRPAGNVDDASKTWSNLQQWQELLRDEMSHEDV
jgi:hypothetical protein